MFNLNQIVKGKVCGTFVIIGFRDVADVPHAILKVIHPETHKAERGELALSLTEIEVIA